MEYIGVIIGVIQHILQQVVIRSARHVDSKAGCLFLLRLDEDWRRKLQ